MTSTGRRARPSWSTARALSRGLKATAAGLDLAETQRTLYHRTQASQAAELSLEVEFRKWAREEWAYDPDDVVFAGKPLQSLWEAFDKVQEAHAQGKDVSPLAAHGICELSLKYGRNPPEISILSSRDIKVQKKNLAYPIGVIFVFLALITIPSSRTFAQSSHYDPRSWSYEREFGIVRPPLEDKMLKYEAPTVLREVVLFPDMYPKGSIVIDTSERRLYLLFGNGRALKYAIGVGKQGFEWTGRNRISGKREWPDWTPPRDMRSREASKGRVLPAKLPGGPNNPLGARALYIGDTLYRIHGTNQPWTVGQANSSGCIRMINEDVIDLYDRVSVGAQVVVHD